MDTPPRNPNPNTPFEDSDTFALPRSEWSVARRRRTSTVGSIDRRSTGGRRVSESVAHRTSGYQAILERRRDLSSRMGPLRRRIDTLEQSQVNWRDILHTGYTRVGTKRVKVDAHARRHVEESLQKSEQDLPTLKRRLDQLKRDYKVTTSFYPDIPKGPPKPPPPGGSSAGLSVGPWPRRPQFGRPNFV
jgi:hypothetical protein